MKQLACTLITVSPLAIRSDHAQEGAESTGYITGTTLAGSLAAVHRLLYPDREDEFTRFFLSGLVQYPDLYPASFKSETLENAGHLPVYPLPKTAQSCKRFPGFKKMVEGERREEDESCHGVRDSLFDWAAFRLADDPESTVAPEVLLKPLHGNKKCKECERAMDSFTGYYRREDPPSQQEIQQKLRHMIHAKSKRRLQTHSGIDYATGTVRDGILYNRHVFNEESRFWGMIKIAEELVETFQQFMDEVGYEDSRNGGLVRIGTGRSRGWGKVLLHIDQIDDEQNGFSVFQRRLKAFDEKLWEVISNNIQGLKRAPFYFALTLHSQIIVRDQWLRYRGVIDGTTLRELLHAPEDTEFQLIHHVADTKRVTGWNELWGTPRTNVFAIDTGSVFLFASPLKQQAIEQALFKLEQESIGERTPEGLGRVCVSDPFHQEVTLQ